MESSNQVAQIALETGEVILHVLLDDVPDVVTRRLVPVGGRKVELLMPDLSVRQAHVAFLLPILLCRLRAACPVGFRVDPSTRLLPLVSASWSFTLRVDSVKESPRPAHPLGKRPSTTHPYDGMPYHI